MPFVPTPATFFSAAGGVVIRRTFSAGTGRRGLKSAAQFSTGCIVIGGTVCQAASFIQVVILHTISGSRRWNPPHSLRRAGLLSAAQFRCGVHRGAKKWLLSGAQFGLFSAGGRLLSTAQFARWVKFGYCYRQHISEFRLLSKRVRTGLLSSAHFRQWGCYRAHSFQTVEFWRLLLSTAHFLKNPPYSAQPVLLFTAQFVFSGAERLLSGAQFAKIRFFCGASCRGLLVCAQFALQGPGLLSTAQYKDFSARVVIQRTFPSGRIFPSALLECCTHFSLFLFSRPGLLYSTLFKNPTKFSLPPFSCKKTFLPLLRSAHCCVLHIRVGMLRTAPL